MSAAMAAGGTGAVVRQGHLRKLKTMKKKYFVLRAETSDCSARLEYYESEKKFKAGAAPRRVLPLKSCYNIMRRLDLKQKHVIALFTREEQFCLVADNELDLHAWLTAILKQHRSDDASEELLHPIQHVWQVNVQKRGLGATKNIQGLYNLCLTDKTLTLVKIKSHNNVIRDLGIPERVEYSLKNIRRCGDSECFFYMEVGRQTVTGSGELWMHSDDSNIAQSMHSTIYHAMRNCAKETENDRDHIVIPSRSSDGTTLPARRQTYSDGRGRAGLCNDKGLCVGSCIKQCVCSTATYSIDDSAAAIAPLTLKNAENQPPNNTLTDPQRENPRRVIKHHRTVSLPTGCPLFQEPLKIVHERTRSAPLTGDEVDRATIEKAARHSSCKAVNGTDVIIKKCQWSRRASTGTRLSKLSPAHTKNTTTFRNRCDSMPSRASSSLDTERPPPRHTELIEGLNASQDETDAAGDWHCTPRIPEEPDYCEMTPRDIMNTSIRSGSVQHSRTSSLAVEEPSPEALAVPSVPDGYLPMAPAHDVFGGGLVSASSGSVCSGTPSTDPRFSEYQLEPATSHIIDEDERPPRAYSVGSRPAARPAESSRHRAYSVGARHRPPPPSAPPAPRSHTRTSSSAPLLPRASAEDLMELDFSNNSPAAKLIVSRTPPAAGFSHPMETPRSKVNLDEYVDMSPRNAGYVEMKPGEGITSIKSETSGSSPPIKTIPLSRSPPSTVATTPDGYVEMNYSRGNRVPTRPIAITRPITAPVPIPSLSASPHTPAEEPRRARELRESRTPLGSQTIFPLSLDSPASPRPDDRHELDPTEIFDDEPTHHAGCLSTVREISEECGRRSPELSSSPQYVALSRNASRPITTPNKTPDGESQELSCNPTATKTLVCLPDADAVVRNAGRFTASGLNYAALDLEPRLAAAAPAPRTYTQIDFARSEKLHAADGN